jgi:hypothetical protein
MLGGILVLNLCAVYNSFFVSGDGAAGTFCVDDAIFIGAPLVFTGPLVLTAITSPIRAIMASLNRRTAVPQAMNHA